MHPLFKIREKPTPEIIHLLDDAILGTNGAHYQHLDTKERIVAADSPLFLTMERNESVLGNITFCRRNLNWYIRYFAFSPVIQGGGKVKSNAKKSNLLRTEISNFFENAFEGEYGQPIDSFYAYIDPNNEKSLWMSENFGFETFSEIATQTFSRVNPKESKRIEKLHEWDSVKDLIRNEFSQYNYYFEAKVKEGPFYVLRGEKNEILAVAKVDIAQWCIHRLPDKFGGLLTRILPFIPRLNKLIRPKNHRFLVPEAIIVKNNDPELFEELFNGMLFGEKLNLGIWWVDKKDQLFMSCKSKVKWGLINRLVGVQSANVVQKRNPKSNEFYNNERPVFTSGFDFI